MKRLWICIVFFAVAMVLAGCKATETGNCEGTDCAQSAIPSNPLNGPNQAGGGSAEACDDQAAALQWYNDLSSGVSIGFPGCWSLAPLRMMNHMRLILEDGRSPATMATIDIEKKADKPELATVALQGSPGCEPTPFSNEWLSGIMCDQGATASGGGQVRVYSFSRGATYVRIAGEVYDAGSAAFDRITANIKISDAVEHPAMPSVGHPVPQ